MPKQIVQDSFETLGNLVKDSGKAIVSEPLNIIKDLLGEPIDDAQDKDTGSNEKGQAGGTQPKQQQPANNQPSAALQQLRQQDDVQKMEKIAKIRQQMQYLQKQKAESDRLKTEREKQEKAEEGEEGQKQQEEVVQLQKEKEKESVLQQNIKALEGTKEGGPRKQF